MATVQVARVAAVPQAQVQAQVQDIGDLQKKNRIQVSNTKKPLFFYVNLAKVRNQSINQSINLLFVIWFRNFQYLFRETVAMLRN